MNAVAFTVTLPIVIPPPVSRVLYYRLAVHPGALYMLTDAGVARVDGGDPGDEDV